MNNEQLQQQIDDMKAKLAEMEALLNQPVINYWQPIKNERYFYLHPTNQIHTALNHFPENTKFRVFQTQSEAKNYAKYSEAEETLRKAIAAANKGWLPDWNKDHNNYFIQVTVDNRLFYSSESIYKNIPSFMYIKSAKLAEKLIRDYKNEFITYLSY